MSKSILEITNEHGQNMYALGLKHAIETIEILGLDALPKLKEKLEEKEK